jgi:hypothetical protein
VSVERNKNFPRSIVQEESSMHAFPRARGRARALICLVSLSAALFAMTARPQGMTATAKPVASSTPADVAAMKRRIDELERRVLELEKQKADQLEADKEDDAAAKKLEQRLAAVEKEQRDAADRDHDGETSHTRDTQVFRAPFVVVDADGKRLVTIDRGSSGKAARLIVGDPKGFSVNLAAESNAVYLQLTDSADVPRIGMEVGSEHGVIGIKGNLGIAFLGYGAEQYPFIQARNKNNMIVAEMKALPESQSGQFMLTNAAGAPIVLAGLTNKGTGSVKTGPNGNGAAALLGNAGMAASEIQGKSK